MQGTLNSAVVVYAGCVVALKWKSNARVIKLNYSLRNKFSVKPILIYPGIASFVRM
jgi:hypothetical protein